MIILDFSNQRLVDGVYASRQNFVGYDESGYDDQTEVITIGSILSLLNVVIFMLLIKVELHGVQNKILHTSDQEIQNKEEYLQSTDNAVETLFQNCAWLVLYWTTNLFIRWASYSLVVYDVCNADRWQSSYIY